MSSDPSANSFENNPRVIKRFSELLCTCHDNRIPTLLIVEAVGFAANKHGVQIRKDAERTPYVWHPIDVADILIREGGVTDADVLVASIFHDLFEDTNTTYEELVSIYGKTVADLVQEVSNPKGLSSVESKKFQLKHVYQQSPKARLIKLADRISNIRCMNPPPATWSAEKSSNYLQHSSLLLARMCELGTSPLLEEVLRKELASLQV